MDLHGLVTFVTSCIAFFVAVCSIWWGVRSHVKTGLEIKKLKAEVGKATSHIRIPTDEEVKEVEKLRKETELARAYRETQFKQLMESVQNEKSREMVRALYDLLQHHEQRDILMDVIRGRPKDFSNQDISGAYLFGLQLDGSDFQNSIAEKADFRRARLDGANFNGANLRNANFNDTHLWRARFTGADVTDANFEGAHCMSANFNGANLRNANFSNADLSYAVFRGADVTDAKFEGADVNNADFRGAYGIDVHKLALAFKIVE